MNVDIPTYLSFFSGAGGLDLAVRLAVPDARCIGYVEIEFPAAAILASRIQDGSMDSAPIWSDIRTFPSELYRGRVAGAVFGFPCQDLSVAGKQEGLVEGNRSGLFFSAMRLVREVGCEWCFLENVPPVLAFPAGHAVLRELAESGFDAEWVSLRAADVGAPHRRERVFILAHRAGRGLGGLRESSRRAGLIRGGATRDWRTPNTRDHHAGGPRLDAKQRQICLVDQAGNWPTPDASAGTGGRMSAEPMLTVRPSGTKKAITINDAAQGWAKHSIGGGNLMATPKHTGGIDLEGAAELWQTPAVDSFRSRGGDRKDEMGLDQQTRIAWVTPASRDWKGANSEIHVTETGGGQTAHGSTEQSGRALFPPGPADREQWAAIIGDRPDLAPAVEYEVRGVAARLARGLDFARADQLRSLGNMVVPIQGALAFLILIDRAVKD